MTLLFVTIPTIIGCVLLAFSILITGSIILAPYVNWSKPPLLRRWILTLKATEDWLTYTLVADLFAFCALTITALLSGTTPATGRFYFMIIYFLLKGIWMLLARVTPKTN